MLLSAALASSCFYDSRWGEKKRTQESIAKRTAPATLKATPAAGTSGAPAAAPRRVLKLRAHATARHASEVIDWPHRFAEMVDDANRVLEPTLGVVFEVVSSEPWAARANDDDLSPLLDELTDADRGDGVDRVVGLIGSVPRYEQSFHQLGMARIGGKHLVVRTMNDAREYEAIQRMFSELDEKERATQYRARKRHKTTTVLLHELGHTLGSPHSVDPHAIMHPIYSRETESFGAPTAGVMRSMLGRELAPADHPDPAFSQQLGDHIERTSSEWVPAERDALLARLRAAAARAAPAPSAAHGPGTQARAGAARPAPTLGTTAEAATTAPEAAPSALSTEERAALDEAREAQRAGKLDAAWTKAKPLFAAHPDVYEVQDLRCKIAMARSLAWEAVQAECAPLMKLVPGATGPRK